MLFKMFRILSILVVLCLVIIISIGYMHKDNSLTTCYSAYSSEHYKKAVKLCEKELASGDVGAALRLALMYKDGNGVSRNQHRQFEYIKIADDKGDKIGAILMDLYCAGNSGDKVDIGYSCEKLKTHAYNDKNLLSTEILAIVLSTGTSLKQDVTEAEYLFNIAAEKNSPVAMAALGLLAQARKNLTASDYEKSYMWFLLAQKNKDTYTNTLKQFFGENLDFNKAFREYGAAVSKMIESGDKYREIAKGNLSQEQIKKVEAMADSWQAYTKDSYQQAVGEHFSLYNRHSKAAVNFKGEGVYLTTIWIDRKGNLLRHDVKNTDGTSNENDKFVVAVGEILKAATPFPSAPDDYQPEQKELKFEMEIHFAQ